MVYFAFVLELFNSFGFKNEEKKVKNTDGPKCKKEAKFGV